MQQGVYDYSPEAGVQAKRCWGQGQAILMPGSTSSFTATVPHPPFTLGSWLGVQWGRRLEEKMLIGQGRWDQPSVLRRLRVHLLLPAQAERRPPEGDLRRGLLPPFDAWGHPLHRCSLPDLSAERTVWGRWSQRVRKMQHLPSLASIYRGLRGAALTLLQGTHTWGHPGRTLIHRQAPTSRRCGFLPGRAPETEPGEGTLGPCPRHGRGTDNLTHRTDDL